MLSRFGDHSPCWKEVTTIFQSYVTLKRWCHYYLHYNSKRTRWPNLVVTGLSEVEMPTLISIVIWNKVFKNGPSEICGRQSLKNLKRYGLPKAGHIPSIFLKAVFHEFYLVHSWILCPIWISQKSWTHDLASLFWKIFKISAISI